MCFDQKTSFFFAMLGFAVAAWAWKQTRNKLFVTGILYFVAMELLQSVQYIWIDQCDNPINKFLTAVGFLHICFQPWASHCLAGAFGQSKQQVYGIVRRLCLFQGCYMFARFLLSDESTMPDNELCPNTEWVRAMKGDTLCTYLGNYHLAWSIPLTPPSYYMPSNFIHFFMMFVPFFAYGELSLALQGTILCLTGPILARYITPNLQEQASIWCFFSILQITLAVVVAKASLPYKTWAFHRLQHEKKAGGKAASTSTKKTKTK